MNQRFAELAHKLGWGPLTFRNIWVLFYYLLFGCVVLVLIPKTGPALLFPAYFILGLLLVTTWNRTLPLRWVVVAFIYGCTVVPFVTLVLAWPIDRLFGTESRFRGVVLIPVLEETLKVVPLLLFLARKRWPFRWTVGASDLMILGAALGGGFAFYEDTLLGYIPGGVARMTASEFILGTHQATPHLGPLYLFPSMDIGSADTAYIGHAAATAFVGLALGLARLLAGRLGRPAYALPLVAWFWVVVDHGLFNHVAGTGRASGLVKFLYTIDAWGRLSSIVLYLVLGGTLVYERWVLWRYRERTRKYALDRDNLKLRKERAQGVLDVLAQVVDLRSYLRQRRGLTYALHVYHSAGRDQHPAGKERLHVLQFLAFLLARSKSRLEITPSLPLAEG